jgi:hypothetical protein
MIYKEFLEQKKKTGMHTGVSVDENSLNDVLFGFQKYCVKKALDHGRFALFEDCGLGKTIQQLEWANHIITYTCKPVLILAPLAVTGQTIMEGNKFGYIINRLESCASIDDACIYISNYEQLENIDAGLFSGIALDESSILKNFEGKMRNLIIDKFMNTPYKSCWTATPSPNDPMELGNHAEFLGIMTRNEMLSMYFVHDGGDTSKWRIKGHAEKSFWRWVASWAIMINKPSDIGFSDEGYVLPDLLISERMIETAKRNNGMLFNHIAVSATNFNQELKITKIERLEEAAKLVDESAGSILLWVRQNEEADYIKKLIPKAVEVRGNEKPEIKEHKLIGFAKGEFDVLITKTKIAQFGLNYQNCGMQIFASPDFSFESIYQAIRRSWRFGRKAPVNIVIITTDTMQNVISIWNEKQKRFQNMQDKMVEAMKQACLEIKRRQVLQDCPFLLPSFLKTS